MKSCRRLMSALYRFDAAAPCWRAWLVPPPLRPLQRCSHDGLEREDFARLSATRLRFARLRRAQKGTKSNEDTRVALVAFERGITNKELEQFYYVNRKGAK